MIIYLISFMLTSITAFALGLFVYFQNKRNSINRTWFLLSVAVSIYSFFYSLHISAVSRDLAIVWGRVLSVGSILASPLFLAFVSNLTNRVLEQKRILKMSFVLAGLFLAALPTPLFFKDAAPQVVYTYYAVPGVLYPYFLVYFGFNALLAHFLLISDLKKSDTKHTVRIKYMLLASVAAFLAAFSTFLPLYGITSLGALSLFMPLYPLLVSFAIVKHQLMDIDLVIRRTAVFAGIFAFVYGIFTIFTIIGQDFFRSVLGWNQWGAMIPTVVLITFSLRPVEIFLTNITEQFLFQKKYDYRQLLKTFADEILTILDLQKLLDQTVLQLQKIIKLDNACVLLYQAAEKSYTIVAAVGFKEKDIVYHENDLLITMLREGHHPIQRDKASEKVDGDGRLKDDFKRIKAQLCLPIMLHDELIGVLALGTKKSGEDYTQEDVDILSTLARTEAIAISNARLFDELSKTQAEAAQREKMAVIGTLAAGINHEICNPLGIVRGQCEMFLLNMRDGLYKEKSPDDLIRISSDIMSKVIKETDRATAITKKLSSFAKPSKKQESEEVSVKHEVDEVLGLLGHDLKLSNIDFRHNLPADFPDIFVDRKQFQEVLFNIIRNAAQAMDKKEGFIAIEGHVEAGAAVVRIADNGMGIPKEKLNQIFNPFYTTKAPGKGTGLGLFIVKQVVERNKGTIEVQSIEGEGTTFILRFPAVAKLAAA